MEAAFTTGNKELDRLIGPIHSKYMLLIVGHPGAGKTTLASSICYENAQRGYKCLYISFYEDKDKFYRNMDKLGIDLADIESRGLLTHVKLPVVKSAEVLGIVNELIVKDSYKVVVLDSINPVLELYRKREQRAILLNFFYNLIDAIDGLLVAISEISWGKETLNLGSIDFVADAIIYLKHRITRGLLVRVLELRKIRGSQLSTAEIPFDIVEKRGIIVYAPRRLERPRSEAVKALKTCMLLEDAIGAIYKGDIISVNYPPNARPSLVLLPLINFAVINDIKLLGISYRYSLEDTKAAVEAALIKYYGLSLTEANWIINNYMRLESINPATISIPQIVSFEMRLVEKERPGIVVFHAREIPWRLTRNTDEDGYWTSLVNQLTWLENHGITTAWMYSRVDQQFVKMSEALADISIRAYYKPGDKGLRQLWYTWRRGQEPRIVDFASPVTQEKIQECSKMLKSLVHEKLAGGSSN
ncbi:MAG: ATPase domain-containing protein [Desulfurococcaceae archaeon]